MKLSKELELTLNLAVTEAKNRGHEFVTIEHLLFALLYDHLTKDLFLTCGGDVEEVRSQLEDFFKEKLENIDDDEMIPQPSLGFQRVIQEAATQSYSSGKENITNINVFVAMFSQNESFAFYYLAKQNIKRFDVIQIISQNSRFAEPGKSKSSDSSSGIPGSDFDSTSALRLRQVGDVPLPRGNGGSSGASDGYRDGAKITSKNASSAGEDSSLRQDGSRSQNSKSEELALSFLDDMCEKARQKIEANTSEPLIGRDYELDRLIHILNRKQKNNPILVGETGVGKTAIAMGLAQLIVEGKANKKLNNAILYSLNMGKLLAGTKFRGEFEERINVIVDFLQNRKGAIVFIDEIHTIVGAGSTGSGSMDASNLLKPALADGQLRCIGATTYKEYRQSFTSDAALSRRFQKIDVRPPSDDECLKILKGLKSYYEDFHDVKYSSSALKDIVYLSTRYITDRFHPDKAIDVMDEVGALVHLRSQSSGNASKDSKTQTAKMVKTTDVAKVIASLARIPQDQLKIQQQVAGLHSKLSAEIFGQEKAVRAVVNQVKVGLNGMSNPDKPLASFLLTGPTGVGKTQLAKSLAKALNIHFIRFDMSEFMEKHAVARLIGAPPGYVGYDQGGVLTEEVRKHPYSLILFDEIEKAHADVLGIMLQILDHGTLTDHFGSVSNYRNVIIMFTSNLGASALEKQAIGFSPTGDVKNDHVLIKSGESAKGGDAIDEAGPDSMHKEVKQRLTPEFRNRLDRIVNFDALSRGAIKHVARKFVKDLQKRLMRRKVALSVDESVIDWVVEKGFDLKMGARPMERAVNRLLAAPLAQYLSDLQDPELDKELSKKGAAGNQSKSSGKKKSISAKVVDNNIKFSMK